MPKRRAASRWLSPSTWQAWRTRAYSSTAFILTLPAVRTGRKIRRRLFTPPPRADRPADSLRESLSPAYSLSLARVPPGGFSALLSLPRLQSQFDPLLDELFHLVELPGHFRFEVDLEHPCQEK